MIRDVPHRRYNPLLDEWVLVSPHRTKRPWQGQTESETGFNNKAYDPDCYLCPGNSRAGGVKNPEYNKTFTFVNDFSALLPETDFGQSDSGLFRARNEKGLCKVVCFSPRHDLTLALMPADGITDVINTFRSEYEILGSELFINYVQIFENRGAVMGCSNPHPHGQIWATETVPNIPEKEQNQQILYRKDNGACLLCDVAKEESKLKERIIIDNPDFLAIVPFWAVWPFETIILPKRHMQNISLLSGREIDNLALTIKELTTRYDNLFKTSFPYSMGIHQAPTDGKLHDEWHFHIHFYPPLLRSASIKKFMVGYELMAQPQRDILPETAAEMLRSLPEKHFYSEADK